MKHKRPSTECCRIVLTGGPGGGKTTAIDLFRREIGDRVVIVPEAATILFQGGFPRSHHPHAMRFAQTTIFHVQRNLEDVQASLYPGRTLLCDRGTVDGAAYWPGEPHDYFGAVGTTQDAELHRYDAVIFFESAAVGGATIEGGNPMRNESAEEAVRLDAKLRGLWARHPRFILVPHNPSFFKKISFGLAALEGVVAQLARAPRRDGKRERTAKKGRRQVRRRALSKKRGRAANARRAGAMALPSCRLTGRLRRLRGRAPKRVSHPSASLRAGSGTEPPRERDLKRGSLAVGRAQRTQSPPRLHSCENGPTTTSDP